MFPLFRFQSKSLELTPNDILPLTLLWFKPGSVNILNAKEPRNSQSNGETLGTKRKKNELWLQTCPVRCCTTSIYTGLLNATCPPAASYLFKYTFIDILERETQCDKHSSAASCTRHAPGIKPATFPCPGRCSANCATLDGEHLP